MREPLLHLLFMILIVSVTGCVNIATTGAQAIYNNHSIKKSIKDQYITMQAYQKLYARYKQFEDANISVATFNREILIAGQVPTRSKRSKIEKLIKNVPDVKAIYNGMYIAAPASNIVRLSDAWITAKVKAKLIASADLDATQIKVVTENGTVYLMGILLPEEAEEAVDLARETDGVQKVVRLFSYIKISKTLA